MIEIIDFIDIPLFGKQLSFNAKETEKNSKKKRNFTLFFVHFFNAVDNSNEIEFYTFYNSLSWKRNELMSISCFENVKKRELFKN